jgi:hypothetical protein
MGWKRKPELLGLHEPREGPGISRPMPGQRTSVFQVVVTPVLGRPLSWTGHAVDAEQAIKFARNRWPNAKDWKIKEGTNE